MIGVIYKLYYFRKNFIKIANINKKFLELSIEQLNEFIINDDLNVCNEENLFDLCIKWIDHDIAKRKSVRFLSYYIFTQTKNLVLYSFIIVYCTID